MKSILLKLVLLVMLGFHWSCNLKLPKSVDVFDPIYYNGSQTNITYLGKTYSRVVSQQLVSLGDAVIKSGQSKDTYWLNTTSDTIDLYDLYRFDGQDITTVLQETIFKFSEVDISTFLLPEGTFTVESVNIMPNTKIIGADTRLVRPPNRTKFSRMFTTSKYKHARDTDSSDHIYFSGLILDGNMSQQGAYREHQLEHQALIFLSADNRFAGKQRVLIEKCKFQNGAGDAVHVYTNVSATIRDCEAKDVFRGAVTITGGHSRVIVERLKAGGSVHVTGVDIEVDGPGYNDSYYVDVTMTDVEVDGDFDIGVRKGRFIGRNIVCHNGPYHFLATDGTIEINDSKFVGGKHSGSVIKFPKNIRFRNCIFELNQVEQENFLVNVYWSTNSRIGIDQRLEFIGCRFINDDDKRDMVSYGIYTKADAKIRNNNLLLEDCSFEGIFDYALYMKQGGNLVIKNSSFLDKSRLRLGSVRNAKRDHVYNVRLENIRSDVPIELDYADDSHNSLLIKNSNVLQLSSIKASANNRTQIDVRD